MNLKSRCEDDFKFRRNFTNLSIFMLSSPIPFEWKRMFSLNHSFLLDFDHLK